MEGLISEGQFITGIENASKKAKAEQIKMRFVFQVLVFI